MTIVRLYGPILKPGKSKRRELRGGREVASTPAAWEARRKECYDRARGRCERNLGHIAPLHDVISEMYGDVAIPSGHAHHKNGTRGLGGGKRDDSLENLQWLCAGCHKLAHIPTKVVPKKQRVIA